MTTLGECGYEEVKVIGRGQYGKAHLVRNTRDQSTYVAKTIDLSCLAPKERQTSLQEVTLLQRLSHPNIVDYRDNFFVGDTLVIIMQYCDGGDLASYIKEMSRRKMKLREVQIMKYFVQVLHALRYIHQERILHRDLKSSNLFLLNRRTWLKVGDFGISRVLEGSVQGALSVVGTPFYLSPEVCENKPYTYKSDIWSLGCVLYELCQQKHAFSADNLLGLVYKIVSDKYEPIPRLYSQALNALVQRTLEKVVEKRPTVTELLADGYVQSFVTEYERGLSKVECKGTDRKRATRTGLHQPQFASRSSRTGPHRATSTGASRSATREVPREAHLRRRHVASERQGLEPPGDQRHSRTSSSTASAALRVKAFSNVLQIAGKVGVLEVTQLDQVPEHSVPLSPGEAVSVIGASPANSFLESTTYEESSLKPNEAWAVQEIADGMSSAEEYEDDFEEDYEGEDNVDQDQLQEYCSIAEEVDECLDVEDMEAALQ